jgi:hypothetical protein
MKSPMFFTCLMALFITGCAHPLETVVEERMQARMDASNANQPLTKGAGDGLGKSFAQSQVGYSLRAAMQQP